MRFGLRAKSVEDVNKVKTGLIKTRRIIFTPSQDLKDELADTAIQITCNIVKRVTSADAGEVEDTENEDNGTTDNGSTDSGSQNSGSQSGSDQGGNSGSGSDAGGSGTGDNTGGSDDEPGGSDH